jgi:hypothetical protein
MNLIVEKIHNQKNYKNEKGANGALFVGKIKQYPYPITWK